MLDNRAVHRYSEDQTRPTKLFNSIDSLPKKQQARLEASWAGTFYHQLFCRIDEAPFADVYGESYL